MTHIIKEVKEVADTDGKRVAKAIDSALMNASKTFLATQENLKATERSLTTQIVEIKLESSSDNKIDA